MAGSQPRSAAGRQPGAGRQKGIFPNAVRRSQPTGLGNREIENRASKISESQSSEASDTEAEERVKFPGSSHSRGLSINSTLIPVDACWSSIEILKRAVDRSMDPTRNLLRATRNLAVNLELDIWSVKRGSG